ncbi:MAG: hypothetical protein LIP28_01920, partial [Deltaproteobacteria bacterium]|nr:hypothetical protein [Deltaproteobacteria bacterium]
LYTSLIEYANNKTIVEHPGCKYYQDDFLSNANIKINSIVCHLLEDIPNQYAGIGCSEAVELFFKAILHHKFGYEKDTLKKSFGHNLCKLFNKVINLTQDNQMRSLGYMFDKFPTMNSRYDATPYTNQELWNLYFVTQMIATTSLKILS